MVAQDRDHAAVGWHDLVETNRTEELVLALAGGEREANGVLEVHVSGWMAERQRRM